MEPWRKHEESEGLVRQEWTRSYLLDDLILASTSVPRDDYIHRNPYNVFCIEARHHRYLGS